jgi:phage terminase small subunit
MAKNAIEPVDNDADYGPLMSTAIPKERLFVLASLEGKSQAQASREAGFGNADGTTSAESFARIGHRLLTRSRVIDALAEQSRKTIRSLAPAAISAVRDIITTTNHKDRAKISLAILNRVDPEITRTDINVTHEIVDRTKVAIEHLKRLKDKGANREFLLNEFGPIGLAHYETLLAADAKASPVIDAEFTEVPNDAELDAQIAKEMDGM